jgi:diguanylate cyclase (GGDEF)-like protein
MEAKLEFLAYHDPLTGLSNRLRFHDRLELELAHSRRDNSFISVLFLNLDHFKGVNDSLGHDVGDHLLIDVGHRIQRCLRQSDTVARFGDDSFVVLLPRLRMQEDVGTVAEKITDSLGQAFFVLGQELHVMARIGVASFPDDGEDPETLLRNANAALNQAKALGAQTFQVYNPRINQEARERMVLENGIRKCLAQEELLLHYQPIIDTSTGGIHSLEALLRWQHPEMGMVSPDRFIPIAEDSGMIHPMGDWILRRAARQLKVWQDLGFPDLRMAVNLSPKQLRRTNLWQEFADIVAEAHTHPSQIELEITESSLLGQEPQVMENLRKLREVGFGLALDDFGTGYSCLSYLKRLPLTALKVDRSFIREVNTDPEYASITYAIIAIAKALKLRTVAEGVETQEQCQFLWSAQCDAIQGFLFNKPMPPDNITALLLETAERRTQYQRHFPSESPAATPPEPEEESMPTLPDFTPRPREAEVSPQIERTEGLGRFYP